MQKNARKKEQKGKKFRKNKKNVCSLSKIP